MKKVFLAVLAMVLSLPSIACTSFLVGKKASTDGSVFISYNADDYGMYGHLIYLPHAIHPQGTMRKIIDGDTNHYLGEIPEATETYKVNGYINEFQVSIMESTWGGREELIDSKGIIDYVSLMRIALQRSKTAREAINVMTTLVEKYGYASSGESFSIADKNEIWIMEMIGKGTGVTGANWVAVRIPDDCIAAHANQSRIHKISQYAKKDVLYSKDLISFARKKGYFSGKDNEFDFANAFAPADFGAMRFCEARVWSFFNRFVSGMEKYLDYVDGHHIGNAGPMPLYMRPTRSLSRQDIMDGMRDHYEGTPFDVNKDMGQGPWEMPYRPTPLQFKYERKTYFNERPISTQQTADTYIAQLRSYLPDAIGGILWYGSDDPNMISYTPIYCHNTIVPECFNAPDADGGNFSWKSAFWVCNWVSNMTYPRYNQVFPAVQRVRNELDSTWIAQQPSVEAKAQELYKTSPDKAQEFLNSYSLQCAATMLKDWKKLGEYIIVKYNDMTVKPEKNGEFERTADGLCIPPKRTGFSESYKSSLIKETGNKYLVPSIPK